MEDFGKNDFRKDNDAVFSKSVKAGKRTYFFDVKATRQGEHYITITESKKIFEDNGSSHYEKHKIFLYKEDFDKYMDCLNEALQYIKENERGNGDAGTYDASGSEPSESDRFTNINYEDLDK